MAQIKMIGTKAYIELLPESEKIGPMGYVEMNGLLGRKAWEKFGDDYLDWRDEQSAALARRDTAGTISRGITLPGERYEVLKGALPGKLDFMSAAALFIVKDLELYPDWKFEVIEVSPRKAHFRIRGRCVAGVDNSCRRFCEQAMSHDPLRFKYLTGKLPKMTITKTMAVGDEYCELIFEPQE